MPRPKLKTIESVSAYHLACHDGRRFNYVQLKRDGIWLELRKYLNGESQALTRHPDGQHCVAHQLRGQLQFDDFCRVNNNPTFYCELFAPEQDASQVKSLLASGELEHLRIEAFASPDLDEDADLEAVAVWAAQHNLPFAPYKRVADVECDYDGDVFQYYEQSEDCEGLVFKDGNLLNWAKWKETLTTELIITSFTEGRGKHEFMVGAMVCELYRNAMAQRCDTECGTSPRQHRVGGFDDALRHEMTMHPEQYLGRVVEVAYQRVDSNGGLRHPRFIMFRDDKSPEECTEI
jgi:hypothetical protein